MGGSVQPSGTSGCYSCIAHIRKSSRQTQQPGNQYINTEPLHARNLVGSPLKSRRRPKLFCRSYFLLFFFFFFFFFRALLGNLQETGPADLSLPPPTTTSKWKGRQKCKIDACNSMDTQNPSAVEGATNALNQRATLSYVNSLKLTLLKSNQFSKPAVSNTEDSDWLWRRCQLLNSFNFKMSSSC